MKKSKLLFVALAFGCAILFLTTSCAKKQVRMEESIQPATAETEVETATRAEPEATTQTTQRYEREEPDLDAYAREREFEQEERERLFEASMREFESEKVYFDYDKSELRDEARTTLRKKATWLEENPEYSVRIEGHCDERGTNEYNLALGERRANAAKDFLVALGISTDRLMIISYGEEKPEAYGSSEEAWAENRRDEFKLLK
jgi:peptidoglycan-associated lipoprotein